MESTGRWSNCQGSLNPKCHYEYQEMEGVTSHPIHPPSPDLPLDTEKMYSSLSKGDPTVENLVKSTTVVKISETLDKTKLNFMHAPN